MAERISEAALGLEDALTKKLVHLGAMLAMTWGERGEAFRRLSGELQSNFMWARGDVVAEAQLLADQLIDALRGEVSHG
ncbi:MAG: hypothetical protein QM750_23165 [Rubrivivax sp.]